MSLLDDDGTKGRIIAQYPVFVDFFTTIDELEDELGKVVQKLAPLLRRACWRIRFSAMQSCYQIREAAWALVQADAVVLMSRTGHDFFVIIVKNTLYF